MKQPTKASEAQVKYIASLADPIVDQLLAMKHPNGIQSLCYIATMLILGAKTAPGIDQLEAWDHVALAIRRSIADNLAEGPTP